MTVGAVICLAFWIPTFSSRNSLSMSTGMLLLNWCSSMCVLLTVQCTLRSAMSYAERVLNANANYCDYELLQPIMPLVFLNSDVSLRC